MPNAIAPVLVGTGAAASLDAAVWWKALLALAQDMLACEDADGAMLAREDADEDRLAREDSNEDRRRQFLRILDRVDRRVSARQFSAFLA